MNTIQSIRESRGLTQESIALRLEVDRSTVAKWETGKSYPRPKTLIKLAEILGTPAGVILEAINSAEKDGAG